MECAPTAFNTDHQTALAYTRCCTFCRSQLNVQVIENEFHIAMICPLYTKLRIDMLKSINDTENLDQCSDMYSQYIRMHSSSSQRSIKCVASYLNECLILREMYSSRKDNEHGCAVITVNLNRSLSTNRARYLATVVENSMNGNHVANNTMVAL